MNEITIALKGDRIVSKYNPSFFYMPIAFVPASTFQDKEYPLVTNAGSLSEDDSEEIEWNRIINKPHVQRGLRRRAAEVRRQIAAGETEEGGFAVE